MLCVVVGCFVVLWLVNILHYLVISHYPLNYSLYFGTPIPYPPTP